MGKYYPVFLDLDGKKCLVVGGGSVAGRKVKALVKYGAKVDVASFELSDELEKLREKGSFNYLGKVYKSEYLNGAFLVISATDDEDLNSLVSKEAKEKNILVNVVDIPKECNFIVPSIVERGDLSIAISTSGSSPALSKKIRKNVESEFGEEYAEFLQIMKSMRPDVIRAFSDQKKRSKVFTKIVNTEAIMEYIRAGYKDKAKERITEVIRNMKGELNE